MTFRLSERSLRRLTGVHPRLVALVREAAALSPVEFMVTEGLRTPERQAALVRAGARETRLVSKNNSFLNQTKLKSLLRC